MSEGEPLSGFYKTRDEYWSNANRAIAAGEHRKASELMWGAVTQQLKVLAATHNIVITSHRQFFDFLRQYAAETRDASLYEEFVSLNALHSNFYDEIIPTDTFPFFYLKATGYIGQLERLHRRAGK